MNMLEALRRCKGTSRKVRPVCWRTMNPDHWIQYVGGNGGFFAEYGTMEEMPHALRLARRDEFLGDWEFVETASSSAGPAGEKDVK